MNWSFIVIAFIIQIIITPILVIFIYLFHIFHDNLSKELNKSNRRDYKNYFYSEEDFYSVSQDNYSFSGIRRFPVTILDDMTDYFIFSDD